MQNEPDEVQQQQQQQQQWQWQWTACSNCQGEGRRRKRLSKKAKFKRSSGKTPLPTPTDICKECQGSGLVQQPISKHDDGGAALAVAQQQQQHSLTVAICGGGIGGLALAAACQHRGIQATVYERDASFQQRQQGYGLTLQQAAPQLRALGVMGGGGNTILSAGITSTKHIVHQPNGKVVGEWGLRKWLGAAAAANEKNSNALTTNATTTSTQDAKRPKRQNVHIARQALRYELFLAATRATADGASVIQWNHRLVDFQEMDDHVLMTFQVQNDDDTYSTVQQRADLLVGADGIRSQVRQQLLGGAYPLRYLGCIVILGICPLEPVVGALRDASFAHLLDGETVFQTADGTTRIYMMPYSTTEYMWQLSFPLPESESRALSAQGPAALQQEAIRRCETWHSPVLEVLSATPVELVSGYPVYDRDILQTEHLQQQSGRNARRVTLVGDAAHPMSPFKGQGANQALLDALSLARALYKSQTRALSAKNGIGNGSTHQQAGLNAAILHYEAEMVERSAVKVKASAEAAIFLHTDIAIQQGNVTRGAAAAAKIQCTDTEAHPT